MILFVVYSIGVAPFELECDAPRAIDVQRVASAFEAMEIEAWNVQVLWRLSMRVAIYARVSTEDKGQDPENQLRDLVHQFWPRHCRRIH